MTHDETVKVLTLVKGNWMRQPTDDLTIKVWAHIFKEADYRDVWAAVMWAIRETEDQAQPPTAGQIFQMAGHEREARIRIENAHRPRLDAPRPRLSPEAVEKGRAMLRETVAELTAKLRMKNR
jgi:hypothetical protein